MSGPEPLLLRELAPFSSLGALEFRSIAQGIATLDAAVKEAPIRILLAQATSAGKYLFLCTGEVEEVARALGAGVEVGADTVIDDVLLPSAAPRLCHALTHAGPQRNLRVADPDPPAIGLIETYSAPTLLGAADAAAKTGEIVIEEVHLLAGIGGKATALFSGDVESVRSAVSAGAGFASDRDQLAREILIPRPDSHILPFLLREARG